MNHFFYALPALLITVTGSAQNKPDSTSSGSATKEKFFVLAGVPVQAGAYTQVRFLSQQETGKADGFDIRRARLDLKATVGKNWEYRLQAEFAGTPKLLDATVAYKYRDWLKITAGQFYIPFSAENTTSDSKLLFTDRSQVVSALAGRDKDVIGNQNGRDPGLQASGNVWKIDDRFFLDYYIGVFNGAGINTADNNEAKDFSTRLVLHPLTGLDVGGSYYNGWARYGSPADNKLRSRIGTEIAYTRNLLTIQGEYLQGYDGKTVRAGWYALAGVYVYKKNIQLVARYDTYDPDIAADKKNDATTNYVFGANLYFNSNLKLQLNYTYRSEEGEQINNDIIAAQFQASF
jgi:phosphate-selective porin